MTNSMKRAVCLLALLGVSATVRAQAPPTPSFVRQTLFPTYAAFHDSLSALAARPIGAERDSLLDVFWSWLVDAGQVPYAQGEQAAFLYRGTAAAVSWAGDFNGWNPAAGARLGDTDVWMLEQGLPTDARTDYKLILPGNNWILDPANPLQVWSGFGPNSELRMPDYVFPMETVRRDDVAHGTLGPDVRVHSTHLGYDVQYRVYTPTGYEALADLPVLYVTDGHEYAADHLGGMVIVLDNLIADGLIPPVLAVFMDPRNPDNLSENRRGKEYVANPDFLAYVADELVPAIDGVYRTRTTAMGRVILGTSLGGLNAAYFGATRPDVFGNLAIQSPAFWVWTSIYDRYRDEAHRALRIYMSSGTLHDGDGGPTMAAILAEKGYDFTFHETHEGHSWGQWRGLIDEALIYFFGEGGVVAVEAVTSPAEALSLHPFPNPFHAGGRLTFTLPQAAPVQLVAFDVLGRRVAVLADGVYGPGPHTLAVHTDGWAGGVYVLRLTAGRAAATALVVVVP